MNINEFSESMTCSECGGPAFSDLLLAEKKDACYNKVRSRYKVWPSAYASGALVQCRKKGAANWGNKSKNEDVAEEQLDEKCWDTHKQVGMKNKGGRQVPNCVPKESVEEAVFAPRGPRGFDPESADFIITMDGRPYMTVKGHTKTMETVKILAAQQANHKWGVQADKQKSVAEDLDRRGFLRGLGMAAAGAAGLGAAGAAQARATPDWLAKVERAKALMAKGQSREQTARIMGIKGPNPGGAGPMSGDWGAVNRAAQEMRIKEESNPEYDDEAGMADNNLETLQRAVEGIDELIDSGDNLPEWCQEKIAVAKSMLVAVWDYMYSEEASDEVDPEVDAMFEAIDSMAAALARKYNISLDEAWESFEALPDHVLYETAQFRLRVLNEDWQKVNRRDKTDGMSRKAVKAYRRENPGSKLKTAVTTKPSKLKKGGKAAKRRKSFCARMRGMKKSRASAKTKRNPNSPINKALRRWNC